MGRGWGKEFVYMQVLTHAWVTEMLQGLNSNITDGWGKTSNLSLKSDYVS